MTLDERQQEVMKTLARELVAGVQKLPVEQAEERLEQISILLTQLNMERAAEGMRHAACRFGEGQIALTEAITEAEASLA